MGIYAHDSTPPHIMASKVSHGKITILISAYNAERHIVKCLDSIRTQTVPPHAVTIRDDGSSDGTVARITRWLAEHGLPWKVHAGPNVGQSLGRQELLARAGTEHVMFFDADNYLLSDTVTVLPNNADMIKIDADTILLGSLPKMQTEIDFETNIWLGIAGMDMFYDDLPMRKVFEASGLAKCISSTLVFSGLGVAGVSQRCSS